MNVGANKNVQDASTPATALEGQVNTHIRRRRPGHISRRSTELLRRKDGIASSKTAQHRPQWHNVETPTPLESNERKHTPGLPRTRRVGPRSWLKLTSWCHGEDSGLPPFEPKVDKATTPEVAGRAMHEIAGAHCLGRLGHPAVARASSRGIQISSPGVTRVSLGATEDISLGAVIALSPGIAGVSSFGTAGAHRLKLPEHHRPVSPEYRSLR